MYRFENRRTDKKGRLNTVLLEPKLWYCVYCYLHQKLKLLGKDKKIYTKLTLWSTSLHQTYSKGDQIKIGIWLRTWDETQMGLDSMWGAVVFKMFEQHFLFVSPSSVYDLHDKDPVSSISNLFLYIYSMV